LSATDVVANARSNLPAAEDLLKDRMLTHIEHLIAGAGGSEPVLVSVFRRPDHVGPGPGILFMHGGGMVGGNRFTDVQVPLAWAEELDAVTVTVEYRLAPEHPDPAGRLDGYSALTWMVENAARLGVDPSRILLCGVSAGGGLAAGVALMARDHGPAVLGQALVCPMLDDRNVMPSAPDDAFALWSHFQNSAGWTALLGDARGTDRVSAYAAPARSTDLSGLPATLVDVGSLDIFRDEDVRYAQGIATAGGLVELHVWPGGFHAFDILAPAAAISRQATSVRTAWVRRLFDTAVQPRLVDSPEPSQLHTCDDCEAADDHRPDPDPHALV
jgi:acetyl esterase/lipase